MDRWTAQSATGRSGPNDVPARGAAQTSRCRGARDNLGKTSGLGGHAASGGTAARTPRAGGAGAARHASAAQARSG
jgi:hypothetical protein